jgi:hypothetical protein
VGTSREFLSEEFLAVSCKCNRCHASARNRCADTLYLLRAPVVYNPAVGPF